MKEFKNCENAQVCTLGLHCWNRSTSCGGDINFVDMDTDPTTA